MWRILLLSLALHGVLLTLLPQALFEGRESTSGAKDVQALLVTPSAPAAEATPEPIPPAAPTLPQRPPSSHAVPRSSAPLPTVVSTPSASEALSHAEPMPAGVNQGAAVPAAVTARVEPSADGLQEYRLALGREARRFKQEFDRKYDAIERERQRGWQGRVEMTVRAAGGLAPVVALERSSGFPPLDEQALELMGRAVRETAVPPALKGQAFALPVPLEFRISQE